MTDSSNTFREVAQKAIDETVIETPEAEQSETEAAEPEKVEVTPEVEETFASKGELKGKTAEELEDIYQTWNKSYTQKRQSEKAELTTIREERDQLAQRLQDLESKASSNPQQAASEMQGEQDDLILLLQQGQISPAEYHQRLKQVIDSQARAIARQEVETWTTQHEEESRQQNALSEVNNLDDRFNKDGPVYDKDMHRAVLADVGEEMDSYMANNQGSSQGFNSKEIAQQVISRWNAKIDAHVKTRTQQSTQVARDQAGKFAKQNPKGSPANSVSTEPKNFRDIVAEEIAKRS